MAIARWPVWAASAVCLTVLVVGGRFGCESFVYDEVTNTYKCRVGDVDEECHVEITQSYFKTISIYGWRKGCVLAIIENVSNLTITIYGDTSFESSIRNDGFNVQVVNRHGSPILPTTHPTSMTTMDEEKVC